MAISPNGEVPNGDGRKDVKPPHISFERHRAVQWSPLLSLPPEIRNKIWKLSLFHPPDLAEKLGNELNLENKYDCLTMAIEPRLTEARLKLAEAFESTIGWRTKRSIRKHSLRNLGLMETCQDVYNETAPLLWSQRFYFQTILHLQAFLFSNARLDLVRDIFVCRLDRQFAVNYMPAVSALLADKIRGLQRFDVDMSCMNKHSTGVYWGSNWFESDEKAQKAGAKLGFDVYSCMHPWVTKVVRDQGVERLMAILQIPRYSRKSPSGRDRQYFSGYGRIHASFVTEGTVKAPGAFKKARKLSMSRREVANTATAREILRLVNLYDK
ncbi:hypothetical protein DHEL01_v208364 [Diaporthe helianthi]|uniref:Uncharacterized protein n=1 Tax=Diaporthe helianthi TaxID=158607 RepID=A0A2P5HSL1_DIAHE|nr:hypothetical protein DHEL01_v208364 [Diaporthe helianthi]